ncbi:hypothetical protein EWM64_g5445 [Hericium alpestre]|uniref:Chromatin assembly factor 1 subunit A dimerization domain-containing protein n=1 Tax=Hericium alpestre TaxID=135208 RepID=A0A4Y9ZWL7_9AGAM|nr:hypothetical protein EWM64_g5445 [Hericium alpestre]
MADSESSKGKAEASTSNGKLEKKALVEIKNGKILFRQKPMSFEKATETMQEMVKFREFLEQTIEKEESPLLSIPTEHTPFIAKFVQESDKTINYLAKHIQSEVVPAPEDEDEEPTTRPNVLPIETIEATIKSVADRVNYGIDVANAKVPASLCVWRWEVKSQYRDWLPKASRDKIDARLAERVQGKKDLQALFDALPESERDAVLGVKAGTKTAQSKLQPLVRAPSNDAKSRPPSTSPAKPRGETADAGENENDAAQKANGRKKAVDPEKAAERAAKEKERLEKKMAKVEKEKKEKEAQNKSRSIMASFFGKPKLSKSGSSSPMKQPAAASSSKILVSDFDRAFKPFVMKKDSELAPANWFQESRKGKNRMVGDVIVIEDDDDQPSQKMETEVDVETLSPRCHLKCVVSSLPPASDLSRVPRRAKHGHSFKTYHPDPVRAVLTRLSEAELSDDTAAVRSLLAQLRDRNALSAKVLIFHEDARPGYFGTFTRRSRVIGPRTPFARDDVAIDYAYDSGEEWGEEEAGGDDLAEMSDEDKDEDEGSSDIDDWLVDDDEVEAVTPIEEREGMDAFPFPPLPEQAKGKRKQDAVKQPEEIKAKKRKLVVPLMPFTKGPCWENQIGKCEYDPFKQYRIQFFNDTPYPIDPFTFVSVDVAKQTQKPATSDSVFVMPALPAHVLGTSSASSSAPSSPASGAQQPKRPTPPLKNPFPDTHMPFLLTKISSLGTSSLAVLVDSIHQDLKAYKVKKNAIEVKVREICVKDHRKVWVVKDDVKVGSVLQVGSSDADCVPGIVRAHN